MTVSGQRLEPEGECPQTTSHFCHHSSLEDLLKCYAALLARVDNWFSSCISRFPADISCAGGCSQCCRGLFDITLLDAFYLRLGIDRLSDEIRREVQRRASGRLKRINSLWPDFNEPFILNCRPEDEWEQVMPEDDETPCVFLGEDGHCLVYDYRPMTCRLHGIPHVDVSGVILHDEWCSLNFQHRDPLELPEIRGDLEAMFREEVGLIRSLFASLFTVPPLELDTLIPLVALFDPFTFDWHKCSFDNAAEALMIV